MIAAADGSQPLDFEGRVSSAVGSLKQRENQPCTVTLVRSGKSFLFSYTIGAGGDLAGSHNVTGKTLFGNLVYNQVLVNTKNLIREEVITLSVASDHSDIRMNRKIVEKKPNNFYDSTTSNITCKAKRLDQLED